MWHTELEVRTGDRPSVVDLTDRVNVALRDRGDGLAHIFLPHATAGLAVFELGAGSDPDLLDRLDALLPPEDIYRHRHGSHGHGRDHLLPALLSPSLTLPVREGRLDLGVWQSVALVDTNGDNPVRRVRLYFLSG
jgi:secondary thiamine-phosphate synthase enzyme